MLYEQSGKAFSEEAFQHPGADYRGAPFWSWNTLMTRELIEKQIPEFKRMGMGGFHIHVRVGLKNRYLSDEFMDLIRFSNEQAKKNGMLCWLYDEDRYSSGIAGGIVTHQIRYRARWLKLSTAWEEELSDTPEAFAEKQNRNEPARGCFLRAYDIALENGYLQNAEQIGRDELVRGQKWYLYLELARESAWCNNQTYVDTLKKEAVDAFIHCTHDRYYGAVGEDFGRSVPAIFTDEPHINGLRLPDRAETCGEICLPFTEALPDAFGTADGKDFFACIPYLVWSRPGEEACRERYHYYDTLTRMFAANYCGRIGAWCAAHGILFTGHLLGEDSVRGQASIVGDAMRCYREFQLPGIDNLCDNRDFSAAKQAASIARQYHKPGVMSELYGVTQWDFGFKGYKMAGDWQAALGITARVPHLAWASMNGEAKRDYPAAIGWQSPWYRDFDYIENHFARVNTCLTRGRPVVHVGVLHTVESFWLLNGPADQTEDAKKQLEDDFQSLTEWLLTGGIDFDYVAESSLADEPLHEGDGTLHCGDMAYDVLLVPSCLNIRESTLERLSRFAASGGTLLFAGKPPRYAGCRKSATLDRLIRSSGHVQLSRREVLEKLQPWREVDFLEGGKKRTRNLLHQLRQDGDSRWLFIAQAYNDMRARQEEVWYRRPLHDPQRMEIRIRGCWSPEIYDTLTGKTEAAGAAYRNGWTVLDRDLYGNDSLLLRLHPAEPDTLNRAAPAGAAFPVCGEPLPEPFAYEMSEPNVLVLDRFEYALDGENWQPAEEMLRLDNRLRTRLGWPLRCEALAQPYIRIQEERREHRLRLRTVISSETALSGCLLALEEAEYCTGTLNGQPIDMTPVGAYVDEAIACVRLPDIRAGENVLMLEMAYGDCTNPEWMYVLGNFGVDIRGARCTLNPMPEKLYWGDYTRQGFPFYTGNMTYIVKLPEFAGGDRSSGLRLQIPYYSGAAVKASVNGGGEQMLAMLPQACALRELRDRENELRITCLGNRYNGFGQLHLIGNDLFWLGPDSWRTKGASWTDTWQVRPMGILSAPLIAPNP
ncbi:MAG: hypothetical protein IJJ42_01440 [Clostridia bacterium]|nr:hypothetical protein [Clostridia bacterium]